MPIDPVDRDLAVAWAQMTLEEDPVVLDTETTGLGDDVEIVEIAIAEANTSKVLLNTRINPPYPEKLLKPGRDGKTCASDIHGIRPEHLVGAPSWPDVFQQVCEAVKGRVVLIYNAKYDRPIIAYMCKHYSLPSPTCRRIECVMLQNARYQQIWDDRKNDYKWPKLMGGDHSALGDVYATIKLLHEMAGDEVTV